MVIRRYEPADDAAVAALLIEMGYSTSPQSAGRFAADFVARGDTSLLVATIDGEIAGLIATCLVPRLDEARLSCRITDLVVATSRRRQGIGRSLVQAAEASARTAGATRLDLSTGDWRSDAHAFYESMGFTDNARALTRHLG